MPPAKPKPSPVELAQPADGFIRGMVERVDCSEGIEGWVLDTQDLGRQLTVELLVAGESVVQVAVQRPRHDLPIAPGQLIHAGFAFPVGIHDKLRALIEQGRDGQISVRVAESGELLPIEAGQSTTVADFVRGDRNERLEGLDLVAHLNTLQGRAALLPHRPLRVERENLCGFIEQVAVDEAGLVWFFGWIKNVIAAAMPALIIDGQKLPAGIALTMYPRADVDEGASGVIGVIQSDWRPTAGATPIIFFEDQTSYLQGVQGLAPTSKREFTELLAHYWPICHGGHGHLLRHLVAHPQSWLPTDGLNSAHVNASVEKIFVLPSFGCLAAGWVLSPHKTIDAFALKFGSKILHCDVGATSRQPRADLRQAAGSNELLVDQAGFIAVFRGFIDDRDITDATLKVVLSDGASSNHLVNPAEIHRLGYSVPVEQLEFFFPRLANEAFFPDLALALRGEARSAASKVTTISAARSEHVVVFGIPDERSDAFLLFDELERLALQVPTPNGIAFIGGRGALRSDVIALFQAFQSHVGNPASLFLVDKPKGAFYALPHVLAETAATTFTFMGSGIVPTAQGWETAAREQGGALTLYEMLNLAGPQDERLSLDAMGWNSTDFLSWLALAPPYLDGPRHFAEDLIGGAAVCVDEAAWFLRRDVSSPLSRRINSVPARTI